MQTTRILVSSQIAAALAPSVAQAMGDRAYQLLIAEDCAPDSKIDLAFLTREVTGRSTKRNILPSTQHFYDLLTRSQSLAWLQIHSAGADKPVYSDLRARGVA